MPQFDIAIAGAGLIGLSLALRLAQHRQRVAVFTADQPLGEASIAAAGMLAVDDPHNPPELYELSCLSRSLYPEFLESLARFGSPPVRVQTTRTLQEVPARRLSAAVPGALPPGLVAHGSSFAELSEWSLDPRELAGALLDAIHHSGVTLYTGDPVQRVCSGADSVVLYAASGQHTAGQFVDCTGAWSLSSAGHASRRVVPRKGQMLAVPTPPMLAADPFVLRTERVYAVPRLHGSRAGHTIIGASVEDRGFDRSTDPATLCHLQEAAAHWLPELRSLPITEHWAGLRPATADALPLLGPLPSEPRRFIASGHYRNGILLAPATAAVMADLLLGRAPAISLAAFAPERLLP